MTEYDNYNNNTDESILDIDTSGAQEPTVVPDGEYKIRITGYRKDNEGCIVRTAESGSKYFIVTFDIPSEEFSKGLSKIFSIPTEDMEPKRINAIKWDLKCFKKAFGVESLNFDAMIGREGYAILYTKAADAYPESNEIRKFITGA